jgi:hypothetical protein
MTIQGNRQQHLPVIGPAHPNLSASSPPATGKPAASALPRLQEKPSAGHAFVGPGDVPPAPPESPQAPRESGKAANLGPEIKLTPAFSELFSLAAKLAPEDQALVAKGLVSASGDPRYVDSLTKLLASGDFKKLSPDDKNAVLTYAKNHSSEIDLDRNWVMKLMLDTGYEERYREKEVAKFSRHEQDLVHEIETQRGLQTDGDFQNWFSQKPLADRDFYDVVYVPLLNPGPLGRRDGKAQPKPPAMHSPAVVHTMLPRQQALQDRGGRANQGEWAARAWNRQFMMAPGDILYMYGADDQTCATADAILMVGGAVAPPIGASASSPSRAPEVQDMSRSAPAPEVEPLPQPNAPYLEVEAPAARTGEPVGRGQPGVSPTAGVPEQTGRSPGPIDHDPLPVPYLGDDEVKSLPPDRGTSGTPPHAVEPTWMTPWALSGTPWRLSELSPKVGEHEPPPRLARGTAPHEVGPTQTSLALPGPRPQPELPPGFILPEEPAGHGQPGVSPTAGAPGQTGPSRPAAGNRRTPPVDPTTQRMAGADEPNGGGPNSSRQPPASSSRGEGPAGPATAPRVDANADIRLLEAQLGAAESQTVELGRQAEKAEAELGRAVEQQLKERMRGVEPNRDQADKALAKFIAAKAAENTARDIARDLRAQYDAANRAIAAPPGSTRPQGLAVRARFDDAYLANLRREVVREMEAADQAGTAPKRVPEVFGKYLDAVRSRGDSAPRAHKEFVVEVANKVKKIQQTLDEATMQHAAAPAGQPSRPLVWQQPSSGPPWLPGNFTRPPPVSPPGEQVPSARPT